MTTLLQKVSQQMTWLRYYRLQKIRIPDDLNPAVTYKTKKLIKEYNRLRETIDVSLREDYEQYKAVVLAQRGQLKDKTNKD